MIEILVKAPASAHESCSVIPDPDDPVILQLDGNLAGVLEISANGFEAPAELVAPGRRYPFSIDLPTGSMPISGYVDVLPEKRNGHLSCRFVELSAEALDTLHRYMLMRQKEAIRSLNGPRSGSSF